MAFRHTAQSLTLGCARRYVGLVKGKRDTVQIYHRPPESRSRELLAACELPAEDLETQHFDHFLGCGPADDPQGIVGLELFGAVALLRSLAVAEAARGRGCGKALVAEAQNYAQAQGVRTLYLLTTTAADFFARLGYARVERNTAPEQIQRTKEFADLCPESAALMIKQLEDEATAGERSL